MAVSKFFSVSSVVQKARVLKQKKEEGNEAFKSGKLNEAYTLYSEALEIDPCNKFTNAKLYFNRATVAAKVSPSRNWANASESPRRVEGKNCEMVCF